MDTSLVFGIVFALIVVGLLLFFGFKYINEMISMNCESQLGQQTVNLKNVVKSTLALSKDASQEFKITIQSNCFQKVCFVDPQHPEIENEDEGWIPDEYTIYTVSRNKYNFLIFRPNGEIDGQTIEKLRPYVNFCLTSSREVTIRNIGSLVEVVPLGA